MDELPQEFVDYRRALDDWIDEQRRSGRAAAEYVKVDTAVTALRATNTLALDRLLPPSAQLPFANNYAPIYEIYAPTLRSLEQRTRAAADRLWQAFVARGVAQRVISAFGIIRAQGAGLADPDPAPATRTAWRTVLALDRRLDVAWGPATPKVDARAAFDAAMLADLVQAVGVPAPKKATAPTGYVDVAVKQPADAAEDEYRHLLDVEWPRVLGALVRTTLDESANVLPPYELELQALHDQFDWGAMVRGAATAGALEAALVEQMKRLLRDADAIFESYRRAAPLFAPSDGIPEAPAARDTSLLFATAPGLWIANAYEVTRRLMPAAYHPPGFMRDVPAAVIDADLFLGVGVGAGRRRPLDAAAAFFAAGQSPAAADATRRLYENLRAIP